MSAVALRLESFGARPVAEVPDDGVGTERAYQEGYEQGLNHGRETSLDALSAELARLAHGMVLEEDERASLRRQVLSDLAPVLSGVIELLGRASSADRLRSALEAELRQVASVEPGATLAIRCPTDMHDDIRECAARAGLANLRIEHGGDATTRAEIRSPDGRIELDPARTLEALGALIDDIYREE